MSFHLLQKINLPANMAEKSFLTKCQMTAYILGVKSFVEITMSHCFRDKCVFYAEIQDGHKNGRKQTFGKTLGVKTVKIAPFRTVFKIKSFLHLMATKNGGKAIFGKKYLVTLYPPPSGCQTMSNRKCRSQPTLSFP